METSLAEIQTDSYFPIKWPNGYPKQKDVSVSDTHSKTNYNKNTQTNKPTNETHSKTNYNKKPNQ